MDMLLKTRDGGGGQNILNVTIKLFTLAGGSIGAFGYPESKYEFNFDAK